MTTDPDDRRFLGVTVPDPAFASDDGSADPVLAAALEQYAAAEIGERAVVSALAGRRLTIPLVAVLDEVEENAQGLRQEKSSHMATVSIVTPDGGRALLAFTSVRSMSAWDASARGIPAESERAAAAAVEEGADAVLLDVAGPTRFALDGPGLLALAQGRAWPAAFDDPEVHAAVHAALAGIAGLDGADLVAGPAYSGQPGSDLVVVLTPNAGIDVEALARQVAARLSADPVVARSCGSGFDVGMR